MNFKKLKKPYIIAEIGINHEGNYSKAKKLIFEAKRAGADAVKFQVFNPDTIAIEKSKKTKFQNKTLKNESLSNIWKKVCLDYKSFRNLRYFSKKIKIDFICTAFDFESLNLVKKLNLNAIKIASSDTTDIPLLSKIFELKKPVILSTGMSNEKEISKAIKAIKSKNIAILHCVSMYPCEYTNANLKRILALKKRFKNYTIGYSDHCKNFEATILALCLGAKVIEKHFTLNKKKVGLDHSLSADPRDLKIICDFAKSLQLMTGRSKINPSKQEKESRKFFRKGIYVNKKLNKNQIIKPENLIIRRPENKLKPEQYTKLLGKKIKKEYNLHATLNLKDVY